MGKRLGTKQVLFSGPLASTTGRVPSRLALKSDATPARLSGNALGRGGLPLGKWVGRFWGDLHSFRGQQ